MSRPEARAPGRAWLLAAVLAAGVLVADQVSKAIVRSSLEPGERIDLLLGIDLVRVSNSGIAFGVLDGGGALVLAVTVAALAAVVVWFAVAPRRPGLALAAGLLTGGALGNLIDRVRDSAVTDFLDPPLWPAFNVADIAITVGAIALALAALRPPPERGRQSEAAR